MSAATAIRVENLCKSYRLGQREYYRSLRDTVGKAFVNAAGLAGRIRNRTSDASGELPQGWFWALKNVSFEIREGEVVGIIGRNGTGKSTLLKILSRITYPTGGEASIEGRVGSLLEVGTGFHLELTGKENIFLSGTLLGMRRAEILRKFDEIVSFAEVEKFIDTPVKHYSSGMYVRLAFAVAAHLDPEILLVDEVLAVGDGAFQKKCLGKMGDVARQGRTVVFVSHQMATIRRLCQRCVWLESGQVQMVDKTLKVVSAYESTLLDQGGDSPEKTSPPQASTRFLGWEILEPKGESPHVLQGFGPVKFKITLNVKTGVRNGHHEIALRNSDNLIVCKWGISGLAFDPGAHEIIYNLPGLPLRPGNYNWHAILYGEDIRSGDYRLLDSHYCVPELVIGTPDMTHARDDFSGVLNIPCEFEFKISGNSSFLSRSV